MDDNADIVNKQFNITNKNNEVNNINDINGSQFHLLINDIVD